MAEGGDKKLGKGRWNLYEQGKTKNQSCPKCGEGVLLAQHKDRKTCGKCGYMEKI